jgi:hypothetical protein
MISLLIAESWREPLTHHGRMTQIYTKLRIPISMYYIKGKSKLQIYYASNIDAIKPKTTEITPFIKPICASYSTVGKIAGLE